MNKVNYQKELDKITGDLEKKGSHPSLLLHSCCAPCSSYCLLYLKNYFNITCYFYNPNITDRNEYEKRLRELERLTREINREYGSGISVIDGGFETELFFDTVKGLENVPEGGLRCRECFSLRLDAAAREAVKNNYDYFTTTLTISPLKDEQFINSCGYMKAEKYGSVWLPSDFKKKGGYLESIRLSEKYGLYRQNYCGCVYSLRRDYSPVR